MLGPDQQNLLVKCPDQLPEYADGQAGTAARVAAETAGIYHDCKTRHNGLVDAIIEAIQ